MGNNPDKPFRKAIDINKQLPSILKKYKTNTSSLEGVHHNINCSNSRIGKESNAQLKKTIE
jgi:hypothetical protein